MDVSARNRLPGQVKEVKLGQVMAEITLKIGENEVVAVVTRTSAEGLGLKVGDKAYTLVKATEIMVGKD
ncbi:MAG: TOBE domain-containing protein [Campylobacterota bacterium]|nr:TOBE domain-containing protein [Campylobacterota bacterium]